MRLISRILLVPLVAAVVILGAPRDARAFSSVPTGFVSMDRSLPRMLDVRFGIGIGFIGAGALMIGGGAEPYINKKISIPIDIFGAHYSPAGGNFGSFGIRAGVRFRALSFLSIGAGLEGGFLGSSTRSGDFFFTESIGRFRIDAEVGLGREWRYFGISFTARTVFDVVAPLRFIWVPLELNFAFFVVRRWAIGLNLMAGPVIVRYTSSNTAVGGWAGITVGFFGHI